MCHLPSSLSFHQQQTHRSKISFTSKDNMSDKDMLLFLSCSAAHLTAVRRD